MPASTTLGHPYAPDYVFPPGHTLRARLEEIGLSQSDLAVRSGLSAKHVNQIIKGDAVITQETALTLELVTGTPASIWNKLEARYREALVRGKARTVDADDKAWLSRLPINELVDRGCIPDHADIGERFEAVLSFFGVADRHAWERLWLKPARSFRRSTKFTTSPEAVSSWVRMGELEARLIDTSTFNATRLRKSLQRIRRMTRKPDFDEVVRSCAEAGVAVVLVKEVDKCRISGAAWWTTPSRAVVALSDRYKAEDRFWFSFFHEAAHLLLHSKKRTFVDYEGDDDELEEEANRFARDLLIPPAEAPRLRELSTNKEVSDFASHLGIANGIVVGRLHYDKLWPWNKGNDLIRKLEIIEG